MNQFEQDVLELKSILEKNWPSFIQKEKALPLLLKYYELVLIENEIQNLTRLLKPQDFYLGHVLDCFELIRLNIIQYPAIDLGSGVGVPGLLCTLLDQKEWVLVESEKRKAEFLQKCIDELDLKLFVSVYHGRVEQFLKIKRVSSIIVRAVGSMSKIYQYIGKCSTWNNLILLKGKNWSVEWSEFQQSHPKKIPLHVHQEFEYFIPDAQEVKTRKIIWLTH